jgi:hypothetical protein
LATIASEHHHCLAHLIRELLYLIDFEKSMWAFKMVRFFSKVIKAKEKIWSDSFDPTKREKVIRDYFRGDHAPQRHSILLSVIETAKKHGYSLIDSCKLMLNQQLVLQA